MKPTSGSTAGGTAAPHTLGRFLPLDGEAAPPGALVAYDPELERAVWLWPGDDSKRPRALASLSHPNLVPVLELVDVDGRALVVTARVAGTPLADYAAAAPGWRAVVRAYAGAAAGLAAAHAAGLAHGGAVARDAIVSGAGHARINVLSSACAADASTAARDRRALLESLSAALSGAPRRVRATVERALDGSPESLAGVAAQLTRATRPRTLLWAAVAGAVAATAVAIGLYAYARRGARAPSPCRAPSAAMAEVWNDGARARLGAAFEATELSYAAESWAKVRAWVDDYAGQWEHAELDACRRTHVEKTQTEDDLDLRIACLRRRVDDVRALVAELSQLDAEKVGIAVDMARAVAPVDSCADLVRLRAPAPLPDAPEARAEVEAVERELALALARSQAGDYEGAVALIAELVPRAHRAGHRPLLAELLLARGDAEARMRDGVSAERSLLEAVTEAEASNHETIAARAWTTLVHVAGYLNSDPERATLWQARAEAAIARAGGDVELRGQLELSLGSRAFRAGDYELARTHYLASLRHLQSSLGADDPELARVHNNLGLVAKKLGNMELARTSLERAIAIRTEALGADHPKVALNLGNLGGVLHRMGRLDEAEEVLQRAIAIHERGNNPARLAAALMNLGAVVHDLERHEQALAIYERVIETYGQLASESRDMSYPLAMANAGEVLSRLGRDDEASARYEQALAVLAERGEVDHPRAGAVHVGLANLALREQRYDEAVARFERARRNYEASQGPDHPLIAYALLGTGRVHTLRGDWDRAIADLERAVALRGKDVLAWELGQANFSLAEVLWVSQRDRARSCHLVAEAAELVGDSSREAANEIREWKAANGDACDG